MLTLSPQIGEINGKSITNEQRYTTYFINDSTHCMLPERQIRSFSQHFKEFASNPKRKVLLHIT